MESIAGSAESSALRAHVSSTTDDVYAITNLPEEVIAVVFAYVSRSPKSFRDNLLAVTEEKAGRFHEKWVLDYGHGSVAEHAAVHLGVERISRYASAVLEASRLVSVTEYSQRYQRPSRGDYVTPPGLEETGLANRFHRLQHDTFDCYERLFDGLHAHLLRNGTRHEGESDAAFSRRMEKLAFEDARYALTLAVHTNLGLTANARTLEQMVSRLLSEDSPESRALGESMRDAARTVAPTLLKYAMPNEARKAAAALCQDFAARLDSPDVPGTDPVAELAAYTGENTPDPEGWALERVLEAALTPSWRGTLGDLADALTTLPRREAFSAYRELLTSTGPHDSTPRALEEVSYAFRITLSEAAWHQFLRHRMMSLHAAAPDTTVGITVPPAVQDAGLTDTLRAAIEPAEVLHRELQDRDPRLAPYAVTNAHHRRIRARLNLRQFHHIANLRLDSSAQWDIRNVVVRMRDSIAEVHPRLCVHARARKDEARREMEPAATSPDSAR
ncbi:MAG: FAD-dependent thymidylate synthase [Gemmatimonadota bacterium]|nr:FAD-dependent thymidylate synthase [Gemmatimonadota bacterium]